MNRRNRQRGFSILGVILVIIGIIVAIGVWTMAGQTNSNTATVSTADTLASALLNDSSTLKTKFDTLTIGLAASNPAVVTFVPGGTAPENMLNGDPQPKVASQTAIDVAGPNGIWVYTKTFNADGVGTAAADYAMVVAGVKDAVCKRVNNSLKGSETIPTYTGLTTAAAFVAGATLTNPNASVAIDFATHGLPNLGWSAGCISAGGVSDQNLFFRVVKVN